MSAFLGIPLTIIGALLLITGVLAFLNVGIARRITTLVSRLPLIKMVGQYMAIIFVVGGLLLGGVGVIQLWIGGLTGVAMITPTDAQPTILPPITLNCEYSESATKAGTGNVTIRQDTADNKILWLDVAELSLNATGNLTGGMTSGGPDEGAGLYEAMINITCSRTGSVIEESYAEVVGTSQNYRSEVSTSSADEYNLLEVKTQASNVYTGEYQKEIYLQDGATATSSSNLERTYLMFTEGTKERTLGITLELDDEGFNNLMNFTIRDIVISQRTDAGDNTIFTVKVQKVLSASDT